MQSPTPPATQPPAAVAPALPSANSTAIATSIAARTNGFAHQAGFLTVHTDPRTGTVLLELPADTTRLLHFASLATGLGSNPIGLDRGASGSSNVARLERNGGRVLVVFENWLYRSSSRDAAQQRTISESFPSSTVAALPIVAQEGARLLVDATDFFLRDWTDVAGTLAQAQEGTYAMARDRSSIYLPYTKSFPDNTEVDVSLTFAAQGRPGRTVDQIVPDGRAFTLRVHHSFVRPPEPTQFAPRAFDPRAGFYASTFKDFAQPIQGSLDRGYINRHRLQRRDPSSATSPIAEPIVYYIDRGIPEPVRTATVEGARFWERAFNEAGLTGGFVVRDLPEGADPLDIRYNVVQWINRNERGWSVGGSLSDPRTGQILKGMARMDSHRARTDYNLYAGLMGADAAAADTAFVLARVRQVTAHEIGHTLGLSHNYIASTYERGSVMDYPPPRVRLAADGRIDLSQAYGTGPAPFDVWAIRWGYGTFPAATERDSLAALIREGLAKGYTFLSDNDARPEFASDPRTNLWDDQATPDLFFRTQSAVRRTAMASFGLRNIATGEPVATLQERFVPVYFMHRFAAASLAKTIGGLEYANALRGDGQQASRTVSPARQRSALSLLTAGLAPAELAIPDSLLTLLAPRPFGYPGSVELFGSRTRPAIDELGAARSLASMLVDAVLQRERAARLVQQALHDRSALTLGETIDTLTAAGWRYAATTAPRDAALGRTVQRAVLDRLLLLAADREAATEVRDMAELKMSTLRTRVRGAKAGAGLRDEARAHLASMEADITRWLERRELPTPTAALRPPPGDPF